MTESAELRAPAREYESGVPGTDVDCIGVDCMDVDWLLDERKKRRLELVAVLLLELMAVLLLELVYD